MNWFTNLTGIGSSHWLDYFVAPWLQDLLTPPAMPKPAIEKITAPTCAEGAVVAEVLGTARVAGNVLWYGFNRSKKLTAEAETGKGGGMPSQTTGYKYFLSWSVGICAGPVDKIYAVYKEDKMVWKSETGLGIPEGGGVETLILKGMDGNCYFYFGTTDQVPPERIGDAVGDDVNPGYRRHCWAFCHDLRCGGANRAPALTFIVSHTPAQTWNAHHLIGYDYNPAQALYYILVNLGGLDPAWIDEASFSAAADILYAESRGISMALDRAASVQSYCEDILRHVGGVLYLTAAGAIGLRLFRADVDVDDLPLIDGTLLERAPTVTWPDTPDLVNQVRVTYPKRRDPTSTKAMLFKDAAIGAKSLAAIRARGLRAKGLSAPLFTTQDNAAWYATRELRAAGLPLAKIGLTVARDLFQLEPGDCFKFTYAPRGISEMVCRVGSVKESELETGELLEIAAGQDPNYLGDLPTLIAAGGVGDEETVDLAAIEHFQVLRGDGHTALALVARASGIETGFKLWISADDSSFSGLGQGEHFSVWGEIVNTYGTTAAIDDGATGLVVEITSDDVDLIETIERDAMLSGTNLAWLGGAAGEFVSFETVTPLGSNQYRLTGVQRALYGTLQSSHASASDFYFIGRMDALDVFTGGLIDRGATRYWKVTPITDSAAGDLADATSATDAIADYLNLTGLQARTYSLAFSGNVGWNAVTLDASLDWRNRFIYPMGRVSMFATSGGAAADVVGGADDDKIGTDYTPGYERVWWRGEFMFSSAGGAARTNNPHCKGDANNGAIWVNSADGSLMLSWQATDANRKYISFNGRVDFTEPVA